MVYLLSILMLYTSYILLSTYHHLLCVSFTMTSYATSEKQPLDLGIYKVCHETMSFVLEPDIPLLSKN